MNVFKYTDYGDPIFYQKPDYRTANARAHRFCTSDERQFVPNKNHVLCNELKIGSCNDYRPKSESSKEFTWKINSARYHREELAPVSSSVRYTHQFTDKVKSSGVVLPLNEYKTVARDVALFLPREPVTTIPTTKPKITQLFKETHFTNTEGYFPLADPLVTTTELDYRPHTNYDTARTNLIVRKELPFNSDAAFFIPKSRLINGNPILNVHRNSFDRIVPSRNDFVKNFGLTSEMSSNY